jgi:transposase InsO family protein
MMTMATKGEIFREKLEAYLSGSKEEKGRILDSVCDIIGCHRKAAIRRFKTLQMRHASSHDQRGRKTVYDPAVTAALRELWETGNRICAERLHPQLAEYVNILKRDRMWAYDEATTAKLLLVSLATAKRRIAKFENIKKRGGRSTKPSDLKEIIPVRRGPWQNPPPGYGEVDTVAHCGSTIMGDFAYTVQYTDVSTIWTCLAAQWQKGEKATLKSIERIENRLPFPMKGIDPDSGSEFINWHLKEWCNGRKVEMTRTRPYMKNDHARIEQKNYANVRHFVGYHRFDKSASVVLLSELYNILEDYINFFLPSVKCVEKVRRRSRTVRKYDKAQTAYARVLVHPDIAEDTKEKLRQKYDKLNPVILKQKCDRIIEKLLKIRSRLR